MSAGLFVVRRGSRRLDVAWYFNCQRPPQRARVEEWKTKDTAEKNARAEAAALTR